MIKTIEKIAPGSYCVEDSVGYFLARSRTKLAKSLDITLAPYDITSAQGAIVMKLASGKFATAAELAREMYLDSASMTRMIDRLQKRSLIVRKPRSDDRRVIDLHLTEAGLALADQLPALYAGAINQNFADFSLDEMTTLKTLLRKFLDSDVDNVTTNNKQAG